MQRGPWTRGDEICLAIERVCLLLAIVYAVNNLGIW